MMTTADANHSCTIRRPGRWRRGRFFGLLSGSWLLLGCTVVWGQPAGEAQSPATSPAVAKPNFVVISADDLGYGDLGCYGHPTIRTPRLDRLAREGARWTQYYSGAEVCTPSRAALLTGRLPLRSGLCGRRRVLFPDSAGGLPDTEWTVAELLQRSGYHSACIGKWHLGHLPQFNATRHGFARYFGIPYSNDMSAATSPAGRALKWPELPLISQEEVVEREPDQRQLTARLTDEAIQFLRQSRQGSDPKPFFLYLAHPMPHVPIFASDSFAGHSARGLYGDVVEELDHHIGRLLDELDALNLAESTIVFFTSDNGPWLEQRARGGSAGLLREGKGSTWEGGMRVPAIWRWRGHWPAGQTRLELGSALDVLPTVAALAAVELPAGLTLDGHDLSPTMQPGFTAAGPRQELFYYRDAELFAVRRGPWKLHWKTQRGYGQARPDIHEPPLLFHLEHDPAERLNVADQHPEVVADLQALAASHREAVMAGAPQLEARTP